MVFLGGPGPRPCTWTLISELYDMDQGRFGNSGYFYKVSHVDGTHLAWSMGGGEGGINGAGERGFWLVLDSVTLMGPLQLRIFYDSLK